MPSCYKCKHPKMRYVRTEPFIDLLTKPGHRVQMNHRMAKAGHPGIALLSMIGGGVAWLANQMLEDRHYVCTMCGAQSTKTHERVD